MSVSSVRVCVAYESCVITLTSLGSCFQVDKKVETLGSAISID